MDKDFATMLEILDDIRDLVEFGLTEEEIEGYLSFFVDNYGLTVPQGTQ